MHYVVVGAGPAGVIAAETLRKTDPQGEITLIGAEDEPPYSRMAIPYFLEGNIQTEGTHLRKDAAHYRNLKIEVMRKSRVAGVDAGARTVSLEGGGEISYDRLLLATGSRPLQPPIEGVDQPGIHPCWTMANARDIQPLIATGAHVVLIGAGFIGTIILDAIGSQYLTLTVVEADTHMTPRMMNETGGELMKRWCADKGVRVLTSTKVRSIAPGGERKFALTLDNGETLPADLVVTATGVATIIDYLEGSGVTTEEGIVVNDRMQTNIPDIYAAGDVAEGPDFSWGASGVHAIQPTAGEHGRIAALNMAGVESHYRGSLIMNVIATLGLTTYSFGKWMGAAGGDHGEALDEANFRYLRLEFEDDLLVGAINIGHFEHVGILRGLIQNRIALGEWKERLQENPNRIMEAYLVKTDFGLAPPIMKAEMP